MSIFEENTILYRHIHQIQNKKEKSSLKLEKSVFPLVLYDLYFIFSPQEAGELDYI